MFRFVLLAVTLFATPAFAEEVKINKPVKLLQAHAEKAKAAKKAGLAKALRASANAMKGFDKAQRKAVMASAKRLKAENLGATVFRSEKAATGRDKATIQVSANQARVAAVLSSVREKRGFDRVKPRAADAIIQRAEAKLKKGDRKVKAAPKGKRAPVKKR